jgi:UDP-N-acetylmuramate--alanine ligase
MVMPKKLYFIGIGGIGMSALAQYFADHGAEVWGSDREASPVTELLESKRIKVIIGQKAENVPTDVDAVIYSESVWPDNPERARAKELGAEQLSYFQMLGEVSADKRTVAIAGTHGKTTTTGMTAKILSDAGASPSAVVGSIVRDFKSNYLHGDSDLFVVEACEYRRDFLFLSPTILVVTNIEWDHTDYYKDLADVQSAFRTLMEKVPADGAIITDSLNPNIAPILHDLVAPVIDYTDGPGYEPKLPGEFNRMNARAAAAAARAAHPVLSEEGIAESIEHFQGAWRRFEYKGKTKAGVDVYDDYAHHPTSARNTLAELRKKTLEMSSRGRVFVAFHPHLYSRTKDLLADFATAFADADEILIAPIYAAREIDDGTMSNDILAAEVAKTGKHARAVTFDEIEHILSTEPTPGDVIMTMGAGDIYKVADKLTKN